jgi:hypothetical protein
MSLHLDKLLNSSTGDFWASGLVFVMVRQQLAFMRNGEPPYSYVAVRILFCILCVEIS